MLWVFRNVLTWFIVGALVIFQPELRSLVSKTNYSVLFGFRKSVETMLPNFILITQTLQFLIGRHRGALLYFRELWKLKVLLLLV